MTILKYKEVAKVCFVGESGSGKSTIAELTSWATGLPLAEAGEWMRERYPKVDEGIKKYMPNVEDDKFVDGKIIELLIDPQMSFVSHGRTTRVLAKKEILDSRLSSNDYFHVALECAHLIMGARALPKLREKLSNQSLTESEAADILHERDLKDFARYHDYLRQTHNLNKRADLTRTNDPITNGLPLDSGILTPMQELTNVLWMLSNAGKLIPGGVVMGICRASIFASLKKISKKLDHKVLI